MKLIIALTLFGLSTVTALKCWRCENARGNEDCLANGFLEECQSNEQSCQTELRHGGWGQGIMVDKRCKQKLACRNNYVQNPRGAWVPSQCNEKSPSSVCRCCCDTDACNMDLTSCTDKTPRCQPEHTNPGFGQVTCSDGNRVGSECMFTCNPDYKIEGAALSVCGDDNKWDNPAPTCRPAVCNPAHRAPFNGRVKCNDDNRINSRCVFNCDVGYSMQGETVSTCQENGRWSQPAPTCQKISCSPKQVNPANGAVVCTEGEEVGSICSFECKQKFKLIGNEQTVCLAESGRGVWSNPAPTCQRKQCPTGPGNPDMGRTICSDGNFIGSRCEFICDDYHKLVGDFDSVCVEGIDGSMSWNRPVPVCQPNMCEQQTTLPHGSITCSNDNFATSRCEFVCTTPTYNLYPPTSTVNLCLNNTAWDKPMPCCARSCPPYAVMDFIVILDSSSSVGADNWIKMKNFVRNFLDDFSVSPDASHYGIYRYNKVVDTETQIMLDDYTDNLDALLEAFDEIPYDGSGTRTGNAINHAVDVMLKKGSGERPGARNVVLLITDGNSQDPVIEPARRLQEIATVYVLPIQPPARNPARQVVLDMAELSAMAGSDDRLITTALTGGFEALTEDFSREVSDKICGNPCNHVLHEHVE